MARLRSVLRGSDDQLFREPVLPISELLERAGCERRKDFFGPADREWEIPGVGAYKLRRATSREPALTVLVLFGLPEAAQSAPEREKASEASRASLMGRRRVIGVTMGPILIDAVAEAIAAIITHGSATSRGSSGGRRTWSHRNRPSQPAASAATATSTIAAGSAIAPVGGNERACFIHSV